MSEFAQIHEDIGELKATVRALGTQMHDFQDRSDEQHHALDVKVDAFQKEVRTDVGAIKTEMVWFRARWKHLALLVGGLATFGSLAGTIWKLLAGG